MIIHFLINFHTTWGQRLYISGSLPELGEGDSLKAVPMSWSGDGMWTKDIKLTSLQERILSYRYLVRSDDGSAFYEVGPERTLGLNKASKEAIPSLHHFSHPRSRRYSTPTGTMKPLRLTCIQKNS